MSGMPFLILVKLAVELIVFSKDYFKRPIVSYSTKETTENVTLLCNVHINETISSWKNVTYEVEWFNNGNVVKKEMLCKPKRNNGANEHECPGQSTLVASLGPEDYKLGNWVSFFYPFAGFIYLFLFLLPYSRDFR